MDYMVIESNTLRSLVIDVNKAIGEGYKPIGNVSCMVDYYRKETYIQALIKEME